MLGKLWFAIVFFCCCFCAVSSAKAQDRDIDAAMERNIGDKVRGPAKIKLRNLNILRYDIEIGVNVTFKAGPSLDLPFIPKIPTSVSQAAQVQQTKATAAATPNPRTESGAARTVDIKEEFLKLADLLIQYEGDRVTIQNRIVEAIEKVNRTSRDTLNLVIPSDSVLKTGGPNGILVEVDRLLPQMDDAVTYSWPDAEINILVGNLDVLRNRLNLLPTLDPSQWATWYARNKESYDKVLNRVTELQTLVRALDSTSERAGNFEKAVNTVGQWRNILAGVKAAGTNGFTRTVNVGCGFSFGDTKESKVEVIRHDRVAPTQKNEQGKEVPTTGESRIEIITVICSSPLSISGGFGFSTIEEREFVFVASTKDTVDSMGKTVKVNINRFGLKNRSSFRTLPLILLNTRVWEFNDTFAIHASAGAGVDIKTGEAGSDVEFVVGPSVSFKRTLFLTVGAHIGRVPSLVGFKEMDEVPAGISQPPVEKRWEKGLAFTFTYKLR